MAERQVGRPATGTIAKERSATAARAYVASRLAQTSDAQFLDGLGVALNPSAVSRAGRAMLWHPAGYKPRGRVGEEPAVTPRTVKTTGPALRDWLAVDTDALDLRAFVAMLTVDTQAQQLSAYRTLQRTVGIVHVMTLSPESEARRRLLATALIDEDDDRQWLAEAFGRLSSTWSWLQVEQETLEPALRTWKALTKAAARREGLTG